MKRIQTAVFGVPAHEIRDEWNYRPRISPEHLRRLYLLKRQTHQPVTRLVADALEWYFEGIENGQIQYGVLKEDAVG